MAGKWPVVISSRSKADKSDSAPLASAKPLSTPLASLFPQTKASVKAMLLVDQGRLEKEVFKISGYPETKTTTEKKCTKILGKKVCINWPQIWKRQGRLSVFLVLNYPKAAEKDVRQCVEFALTAAVIAGIASGNLALATKTFSTALGACLTKKASEAAGKFTARFETRTTHSEWRRI